MAPAPSRKVQLASTAGTLPKRRGGRWRAHTGLIIGGIILGIIVVAALLAPLVAPYDPYEQDLLRRMAPPVFLEGGSWTHPLGTDKFGRDYLSRLLYGARISLLVGIAVALIAGIIGSVLGIIAGYFGGWADRIISFLIMGRLALPVILVVLAVVALFGASLTVVILVLGLVLWDRYALVMRATTQQIRSADYITAARVQGCSPRQIIFWEVVPNLANNLVVVATLEIAHAIALEAALSFLGLGVPPPLPSWGLMVAEGKEFILFEPWLITIPGIALFLLVLGFNMLGDGLRDIMGPEGRS